MWLLCSRRYPDTLCLISTISCPYRTIYGLDNSWMPWDRYVVATSNRIAPDNARYTRDQACNGSNLTHILTHFPRRDPHQH